MLIFSGFWGWAASDAPTSGTGLFIGTFDMVTKGHVLTAITAARALHLKRIWVSLNHNTDKSPKASIQERETMLNLAFKPFENEFEITIVPEPLEGRAELGRYLHDRYGEKVVGIFGSDTLVRNYAMFFGESYFELADVDRPQPQMESLSVGLEMTPMARPPIHIDLPDSGIINFMDYKGTKVHRIFAPEEAIGLSSSLGRDLIAAQAQRDRLEQVIEPSVLDVIEARQLYRPHPLDNEELLKEFNLYKLNLVKVLMEHADLNPLDIDKIAFPTLNSSQSPDAMRDTFVRAVVDSVPRISPQLNYMIRRISDQLFNRERLWRPLLEYTKTGLYLGTFDEMTAGQVDTIRASLQQLGLSRIVVGVFDQSPNPDKVIKHSWEDRIKNTTDRLKAAGLADKVILSPVYLLHLIETTRDLSARHAGGITLILGENVYDRIMRHLAGIPNLRYAVVPFSPEGEKEIPQGLQIVRLKAVQDPCPQGLVSDPPSESNAD
jgi:nicotinic acid mononucleotide adenylyltransferase